MLFHLLLAAATKHETEILRTHFKLSQKNDFLWSYHSPQTNISLIHTGIGMVNTAFSLGQFLAINKVDCAINFGIAGSFDKTIELGEVVEIIEDSFSELGAESPQGFLDLQQMGFPLMVQEEKKYYNTLINPKPRKKDVQQVKSITVNQVTGRDTTAATILERWNCQIETMEGAAFFHAMIKSHIPFLAYRGISNYVENRNKAHWNIPLAAKNVQFYIIQKFSHILEYLSNSY